MKNLQKKIIEKTYRLETRNTLASLVIKIISLLVAFISGTILIQTLMIQYTEQQTLDLLQIFSEDLEVIKNYTGDVVEVIYQETPKDLLFILIGILIIVVVILLTFIKNFGKIKNKLKAINSYRLKKYE